MMFGLVKLLEALRGEAERLYLAYMLCQQKSAIILLNLIDLRFEFSEHHNCIKDVFLLTTLDEKITIFEEIGMDYLVVLPFTKELAELSYTDFIENIIVKHIQPKLFLVGFNHNFGKNREGNFEKLQELAEKHGFQTEIFPEQHFEGQKVSSSEIRKLIRAGEMDRANQMLGRGNEK